jgi:hypothetical protein
VVVQIIDGILLGPGVLGAALPGYCAYIFSTPVIGALNGIAWWAVMLFVFVAGIELDLGEAWVRRRETGVTAGLALLVPLLFGMAAAAVMLRWPGWIGAKGNYWQVLLGIGMSCAVTALPILVLFLDKLGILRQPLGQRILRYASLDDIAIWGVLALILLDWQRVGRQLAFLILFAVAAWAIRRTMLTIPVVTPCCGTTPTGARRYPARRRSRQACAVRPAAISAGTVTPGKSIHKAALPQMPAATSQTWNSAWPASHSVAVAQSSARSRGRRMPARMPIPIMT